MTESRRDLPGDGGLATTPAALTVLQDRLPAFLGDLITEAGADRLVVGLDGGVETALAAAFAADAIGQDNVIGLVMPAYLRSEATARNAEAIATTLGIDHSRLQLQPVVAAFQEAVDESDGPTDDPVAMNNALSRIRMTYAYYVANETNGLVIGTVNRTEYLLGSVTKYGDTAADCLLFADLYRTEVEALAEEIEVPSDLTVDATDARYDGVPEDSRLDLAPETVDRILHSHVDEGMAAAAVADRVGVSQSVVRRLAEWCAETEHKRRRPPSPDR